MSGVGEGLVLLLLLGVVDLALDLKVNFCFGAMIFRADDSLSERPLIRCNLRLLQVKELKLTNNGWDETPQHISSGHMTGDNLLHL